MVNLWHLGLVSSILVTVAVFGLAQAKPRSRPLINRQSPTYQESKGDGTVSQGWPDVSSGADFGRM